MEKFGMTSKFRDWNLMTKGYGAFHEMKQKGEFCDVTIKFGNHTILAHRIVVATGIPYFREKLIKQDTDRNEITVCDLDTGALESLIAFSYTSEIDLSTENVKALLSVANFLGVETVVDACSKFINNRIQPEDVLVMRHLADSLSSSWLSKNIDLFVCSHFDEVSECDEFLDAPFTYLEELLGRDDLRPSQEEKVLDFALKWVKKSPEERTSNLAVLLSKVRMGRISPDYITDCFEEDLILSSIPCRNIMKDARTFHFLPHRRSMIYSFEISPRGTVKYHTKGDKSLTPGIYAICYYSRRHPPVINLEYFDLKSGIWSTVDVLSFTLDHDNFHLIECNGKLYILEADCLRAYDPLTGKWNRIRSRYLGCRTNTGVTSSCNELFICGGIAADEVIRSDLVLRFGLGNNTKSSLPMPCKMSFPGAVVLDNNLYVLGGKDVNNQCSKSVLKYDLKDGKRVEMASMLVSRCAMGCAALNGKIYVCGGEDNSGTVLSTVEVFDPSENEWSPLPNMKTSRSNFSLVSYNGKLYATGGKERLNPFLFSWKSFVSSIDIFDPKTGKWEVCDRDVKFVKVVSIEPRPT